MEPVLFFAMGGAAVAAFSYYDARRRARIWRAAAESCGVTDLVDPSSWLNRSLSGRSGDLEISISSYRHGKHDNGTRVVVRCPGTAPGLRLHAEGVQTSLKKLFGAREVEIGDTAFDSAFLSRARPPSRSRFSTTTSDPS